MQKTCAEHIKALLDAIDGDEKFVMTAGAGVVNAAFFAAGILSENGYLTILAGTIVAYIMGKVVEDRHVQSVNASVVKA
jgi:hypothetical protein